MNCQKCGTALQDDAKFCYNCGTQIESATSNFVQNTSTVDSQQPQYQDNQTPQFQNNPQYQYQNNPQMTVQASASNTPRRCNVCKTVFHEGNVCPACNSTNVNFKPDLWMGILALVFGISGGWAGLLFAILGIKSSKQTGYTKLKTICTISIPVCIVSMIIGFILVSVIMGNI